MIESKVSETANFDYLSWLNSKHIIECVGVDSFDGGIRMHAQQSAQEQFVIMKWNRSCNMSWISFV